MQTYEVKLKPFVEVPIKEELESRSRRDDGRSIARRSVSSAKLASALTSADISNNAITNALMADDSIKQAELDYETVNVTVSAGAATGTGTVTSGSIVVGWYATGNQDQFVDNISISGTTLTVTLAANATANNTFTVVLLKS